MLPCDSGNEEVMLPCEFCEALFPQDDLVQHQVRTVLGMHLVLLLSRGFKQGTLLHNFKYTVTPRII